MKKLKRFISSTIMKYGLRAPLIVGDLDFEFKGVEIKRGLPSQVDSYDLVIIDKIDDVSVLQDIECDLLIARSVDKELEKPPFLLGSPIKTLNEIGLWNLQYPRKTTDNWSESGVLWSY